jgi:hypothetical protein
MSGGFVGGLLFTKPLPIETRKKIVKLAANKTAFYGNIAKHEYEAGKIITSYYYCFAAYNGKYMEHIELPFRNSKPAVQVTRTGEVDSRELEKARKFLFLYERAVGSVQQQKIQELKDHANSVGSKSENLSQAESQAIATLDPLLRDHALLTEKAFNLIGEAIGRVPEKHVREVSQSRKVLTSLLVRLANDLRCAALLALRGYPIQAAALVACMYEVAYTIAYIRSDDSLAKAWIEHDNPTRQFYKIRSLTKEVLMKLGVPDAEGQTDLQYRVYRQLCMAKHSNPLFQMQHGYQLRNGNVVAMNGPDTSDSAIRAAWFALKHAARLSFLSVAAYVENHVPIDQQGDLKTKIEAIGAGSQQLAMKAADRFGVEDPFPQKW